MAVAWRASSVSESRAAMCVTYTDSSATIDEISGGRMVLGLGVSHQAIVEDWYAAKITKPVQQMREYVAIVRAILRGKTPPEGEFFRSRFAFLAYTPRPDLPIIRRRALAEDAAAGRRDSRRRDALAL